MRKKFQQKLLLRLFILFIIINALSFVLAGWLDSIKIDHLVVVGANSLLFLLAVVSLLMQVKALSNTNPNVFVRSIMAATFIKLVVIITALFIYAYAAGKSRSLYAIVVGMGLYLLYTVTEVRAALEMNKLKDGVN